jgi:hypothetical protein
MSFVFRGTRGDIETGLPGFIPERRAMVCFLLFTHWTEFTVVPKAWMYLSYMSSSPSELSIKFLILILLSISVFIRHVLLIPTHLLFLSQVFTVNFVYLYIVFVLLNDM